MRLDDHMSGCKDGKVFLATPDGKLRAHFDCRGQLQDMVAADLDADGWDELVVVAANPHRVYVVPCR